jgi:hypothetical protein
MPGSLDRSGFVVGAALSGEPEPAECLDRVAGHVAVPCGLRCAAADPEQIGHRDVQALFGQHRVHAGAQPAA